ncbi:T-cell surface antigen CD2-like [Pseudorasbora parva]|uniref:T-cell surface antigen CD2-like n=1 Tax=Pseudorasbora parva TaxID=51549 RepID=UPI00351F624C
MVFRRSHILWILIICDVVSGLDVMRAVNSETVFSPATGSVAPSTSSIIWKHKDNAGVVVKVIEWDREEGSTDIPNPNFKSHASLNKNNGELTLKHLQLTHTGVYTIDINSKEQRQRFTLTVMKPVLKPYITKECELEDVLRCSLSCDGDDGSSESISWITSAGEMPYKRDRNITVYPEPESSNFYTCTLKNAVSKETSDPVYERDLFHDSTTLAVVAAVIPLTVVLILIIWFVCRFCGRYSTK